MVPRPGAAAAYDDRWCSHAAHGGSVACLSRRWFKCQRCVGGRLCPSCPRLGMRRGREVHSRRAEGYVRRGDIDREAIYFRFRGEAPVRTFAGCPLSCSHCIEHVGARRIRRADVADVAAEAQAVVIRYPQVKRIFLADSEVNLAGGARTRALISEECLPSFIPYQQQKSSSRLSPRCSASAADCFGSSR